VYNSLTKKLASSPLFASTIIFAAGFFLFTGALFNHEFVQFEARFGLFAQEMFRNGLSFFPTTYNHYYPDYPATQTILTYFLALAIGKVTILTAVIPTALASAITLVLIYLVGSIRSQRLGIYGVLFALFTFTFVLEARSISLDQFTCAATAFCFYCAYSSQELAKTKRLWLIPLGFMFGFLFRGPIGLVVPAGIVCGYYLIEKKFKVFWVFGFTALGLLALGLLALLSAAWHEGGINLVHQVIKMEALGRIATSAGVPFYYYFLSSFIYYALTFPIAVIILIVHAKSLFKKELSPDLRLIRHLALWLGIVLIGLSLPSDEKARYILPITPAISLIAAYLFEHSLASAFLLTVRRILLTLCAALPIVGLVGIAGLLIFSQLQHILFNVPFLAASIFFISELIFYTMLQKNIQEKTLVTFVTGVAAFLTILILMVQPIDIEFNRAMPFVKQVEAVRAPAKPLIFYRIGPDGEDIKYMVALNQNIQPGFLQNAGAILKAPAAAIVIAKKQDFDDLPAAIKNQLTTLFIGHLGHQACVAFTRKS
jgi:4-amino-4-deoxy-L-arabinose transferase-like glycosyltransferase